MSEVVTLEVRVLGRDDRQVLIEHDGVEVLLTLASVDLVPKGAWATLTVARHTAETLGLVKPHVAHLLPGEDIMGCPLLTLADAYRLLTHGEPLITHRHYGIQPGEPAA